MRMGQVCCTCSLQVEGNRTMTDDAWILANLQPRLQCRLHLRAAAACRSSSDKRWQHGGRDSEAATRNRHTTLPSSNNVKVEDGVINVI